MSEMKEEIIDTLITVMNSREPIELRASAAKGLGYAGGAKAIKALKDILFDRHPIPLRAAVAEALGRIAEKIE